MGKATHGHTVGGRPSPTYNTWRCMMSRCYREGDKFYEMYGGSGVIVVERWHTFSNFLADMGPRPEGTTLGRLTPFSDYGPGECEWQDIYTQNRAEHKPTDVIEVDGKRKTKAQWASYLEISYQTLNKRLQRGWGLDAYRVRKGELRSQIGVRLIQDNRGKYGRTQKAVRRNCVGNASQDGQGQKRAGCGR